VIAMQFWSSAVQMGRPVVRHLHHDSGRRDRALDRNRGGGFGDGGFCFRPCFGLGVRRGCGICRGLLLQTAEPLLEQPQLLLQERDLLVDAAC
jgi:hypothetical protein